MDAEIKATIDRIEAEMRELKQLRDGLLKRFGHEIGAGNHRGKARGKTRKDEVIAFLKTHGPTKAKDLVNETKIPQGSIGWILNDKETFTRDDQGRWSLKEAKESV